MKNLINNQPKEIQVILSCICRKRQSDFMDKNIDYKRTKEDYKKQVAFDRKLIEELTTEIEHLNWWKLLTQYWMEDLEWYKNQYIAIV